MSAADAGGALDSLRQVAELGEVLPSPEEERSTPPALKLYFAARRLSQEEQQAAAASWHVFRWENLSVVQTSGGWAIRAAHFTEDFEDFRFEMVIPLLSHETITLRTHEERCQELGLQGIFYALLDADGSVVLYEVRPPELWSPIDQRRSDEPFLQPEILAQLAQDAGKEQNDKMEKAGEAKKRKRKKDHYLQLLPLSQEDQLLLQQLSILDLLNALCGSILKHRPEASKLGPVLRTALDSYLLKLPHRSSLQRLLTPDRCQLARQISGETQTSPKTQEERRLSYEGENRFWRRLGGQGEYESGSRLRLLRQDALTRHWCCFFVDVKAGPSKVRQYRSKERSELRAHEQPTHDAKCPLCKGREEPTEVLRVWPDGRLEEREGLPENEEDKTKWLVRVLRNPFPYLLTPQESNGKLATPYIVRALLP
eukprot:g17623.t1